MRLKYTMWLYPSLRDWSCGIQVFVVLGVERLIWSRQRLEVVVLLSKELVPVSRGCSVVELVELCIRRHLSIVMF
jgi:hypothetical protein